ncbi:hypothetical protein MTO96_016350 [Rhipicephalus appendiculatus]
MSDTASGLNRALKYLESKQYGLRMYAVAVEEAKHIHKDLPPEQRTERVRQVYHRVKAEYEKEREEREKAQARAKAHPDDAGSVAHAAAAEERLKNINLLLLYYAFGTETHLRGPGGEERLINLSRRTTVSSMRWIRFDVERVLSRRVRMHPLIR